jgi:hypothetical protein
MSPKKEKEFSMKRAIPMAALALVSVLAFPVTARADPTRPHWGYGFGFGYNHGYFNVGVRSRYYAPSRHVHYSVPVYRSVWMPAVYNRVVVGYDHCGRPIFRTVMVRCGHYEQVVVSHRCNGCGCAL